MEDAIRDVGVLDVIRIIGSQRETGGLHVTTGMTQGAFFFEKGALVEARLGKLTGFQAINALASIPDATYSFDPAVAPPAQSSIPANERRLLKDFFGIDVFDREQAPDPGVTWPDEDVASRVVPLSEVEEHTGEERIIADQEDETTLVTTDAPREEQRRAERASKRKFPPPVLFTILMLLIAAGAVVLIYRLRNPSATPATVQTSSPDDVTAAAPDLTGNWNVVNTVEQTSYQAFKNMQVGFNLAIDQTGKEFTGKGEKVSENGRSLPRDSRTPILVKGSIDGDRVEATFSERGAVRKTSGRFVWRIDKTSGGLTGTFVSTAARASGRSAATKQL